MTWKKKLENMEANLKRQERMVEHDNELKEVILLQERGAYCRRIGVRDKNRAQLVFEKSVLKMSPIW